MAKILMIDDDPDIRTYVSEVLQDNDYKTVTAGDGAEGLATATKNPDLALVVLDVNMPGLDGFSTARQLAADPATKGIGVVFVTSKDQKADRVFAQMLGAKGYVTKPYTAAEIVAAAGQVGVRVATCYGASESDTEVERRSAFEESLGFAAELVDRFGPLPPSWSSTILPTPIRPRPGRPG